jgi:hypothetical protein
MQKWYLIFVLALGSMLIGCLGDDVSVEVKPRLILQPPYVKFQAEGTGDLIAQWGPSISDTQTNFKGYYIELYTSVRVDSTSDLDSTTDLIATAHAPKSDTSYIFHNIAPGRYTLKVFGERVPDAAIDSLVLSKFPALYSFTFDPTPVLAPLGLQAHSAGQGLVDVRWDPSPSIAQLGMIGYIVRYRDSTSTSAKLIYHSRPANSLTPSVQIQFPLTSTGDDLPYIIWVKAIRNDSTESPDSVSIVWSGARRLGLGQSTVRIGKKFFIGLYNSLYDLVELDQPVAQVRVNATGSEIMLEALEGAKFSKRIDVAGIDSVFFSAPFPVSDFTETSLTLPSNPASHVWFYILFKDGSRARVAFVRNSLSGTLIHENNSIKAEARYQPKSPYNLPYF